MADIRHLFEFSSIAVVGASDSGGYGSAPYRALRDIGFEGTYFPVNPRRDRVHGLPAYPSLEAIGEPVDLALIAVSREHVLPAARSAVDRGARGLVVISAEFAEADRRGAELQAELAELARAAGVALLGPNCVGVASPASRTAAFTGSGLGRVQRGNVGLVANSGGLLFEVLSFGSARGIGFSHLLSSGNEAGVTAAEAIDFFVADPGTRVVLAVVEAIRQPELFLLAAERAVAARKPIVVLKLGVSEKGARSALTHTGALAGSNAVYEALFRQWGVIQVGDVDELVETAALLSPAASILRRRGLERAAIIEISGGGTELLCDTAAAAGVDLPELSQAAVEALRPVLPAHVKPGNPLDTGSSWGRPDMSQVYPLALRTLAGQEGVDVVVSRYTVPRTGELGVLEPRLAELEEVRSDYPDTLFAVLSRTSDQVSEAWSSAVTRHGLTFLQGYGRGARALGRLAAYSRYLARRGPAVERRPVQPLAVSLPESVEVLNEVQAKDVLREAGLPTVATHWARSVEEAVAAAESLGYPAVAKVVSRDIVHKSDVGGVCLNLTDRPAVRQAFDRLRGVAAAIPGALFEGVAVQRMADPGLELVLGAHRDPQLGPVVLFGLGGIFVELLGDVALRLCPLDTLDAEELLDEPRVSRLLAGARGQPGVDRGALVEALCRLSDLMLAEPRIASIDLNPTLGYPDRLLIVDARVVLA